MSVWPSPGPAGGKAIQPQNLSASGTPDVLIDCNGISKKFSKSLKLSLWFAASDMGRALLGREPSISLRPTEFWALRDVSFQLHRGEALGIIGSNGAGKSTLLKILTGIIKPTTGNVRVRGNVQALIQLGAGMNPLLTARENIHINAAILGIPSAEVRRRFDDIIEFAELEKFVDTPVQYYSSGMRVRLGFAIAINVEPDILILDEVLAVGDQVFKRKARKAMAALLKREVSLIFISHHMQEVRSITANCIWLEKGKIHAYSSTADVVDSYVISGGSANHSDSTLTARPVPFEYVSRRVGEVSISKISSPSIIAPDRLINMEGPYTQRQVRLDLEFVSHARIREPIFHEWILREREDDEPLGYICLRDEGDFLPNEKIFKSFELDFGSLHPGHYKLGYSLRPDMGSALEGVTNLVYLCVKNVSAPHDSSGTYFAKMIDASRGSFRLACRQMNTKK